jgi:hypothetical protein
MKPLDQLYAEKRALEDLQTNPGFKLLCSAIQANVRVRRMSVFNNPIRALDNAFELAGTQGEVSGLQTAIALVDIMLADLQADIDVRLAEERHEDK